MAMTDEEKQELKKLSSDELIDVIDGLRDKAEKQIKAEKEAIIKKFFDGDRTKDKADLDGFDVYDLKNNESFKALKEKINKR